MKHRDIQVISPKALPGGFLMVTAERENITEEMGKGSRFKIISLCCLVVWILFDLGEDSYCLLFQPIFLNNSFEPSWQ